MRLAAIIGKICLNRLRPTAGDSRTGDDLESEFHSKQAVGDLL